MTLSTLNAGRAPLADFNRWVDSLIDNYRREVFRNVPVAEERVWISHIVQKEAIQNSADALEEGTDDKWSVTFEMSDALPPQYITVTDQGTCGLTGRALVPKDELDQLEKKAPQKYQQERWARFEALSFPNIDPVGRGSKGQGKWVFIGASDEKTIVYDTLRKDGVYRVGGWLGEKQLIEKPPEEQAGEELIKKEFSLLPLRKVGARIIITKPRKELWEGFLPFINSPIARYIAETWWESLKNGALIYLKWKGETIQVETPTFYRDEFIKENTEEMWVVNDCPLNWSKNQKARINELVIIRSKKRVPEGFRGIAIQRSGMKIRGFDVQTENPEITKEISEYIYGWISFNEAGERELRILEDTTHYDFSSSLGTFGIHVFGKNGWLVQEIRKFAEQKLGLGSLEKLRSERLDILAVNKLNKFANKHNLGESGRQIVPKEKKPKPPKPEKEIRIKMPKPLFPHEETRRVEFGESVAEIKVAVVNDTKALRKVRLTLALKTASPKIPERILRQFIAKELSIDAESETEVFGSFKVTFDKDKFDDGTYALEAEIVLLEGDISDEKFGKGILLDEERELIYLNVDPPTGKGLFEFIDRIEFKEENTLQYRTKEKDGRFRIQVNTLHPTYKHAEEIDDFLSIHKHKVKANLPNPLLDYEIGVGAEAIAHYDLRKEAALIGNDKDREKFVAQRGEDKKEFFIEVMNRVSRIAQEIRHEVF